MLRSIFNAILCFICHTIWTVPIFFVGLSKISDPTAIIPGWHKILPGCITITTITAANKNTITILMTIPQKAVKYGTTQRLSNFSRISLLQVD
jgi:hypothetical protein